MGEKMGLTILRQNDEMFGSHASFHAIPTANAMEHG